MDELDRMDRRILQVLQEDGRISWVDLAERVGLSATPCTERVRRMEREGVITGYQARTSPASLGRTLLVFLQLKLASKSAEVFEKMRVEMSLLPEVLECHLVAGDFDYIIKARLKGMEQYRDLLGNVLKRVPVAAESRSCIVMEEIKEGLVLDTR
jgi:Lrp/AsnC family transcriptional regulator, leucine-responsive regulatory protein